MDSGPFCTNLDGLMYHHKWIRNREIGLKSHTGNFTRVMKDLYCNIRPSNRWNYSIENTQKPGGIFNLEFSPEGTLLVAACEKKSLLLFDPVSQKFLQCIENAHYDCVNCIQFLDTRMFATCSDDHTIALWDIRNMRSKIKLLLGHSNWVKNVEYDTREKLLVTSGFDGSVFTWDLNRYTDENVVHNKAFYTTGLMRMKLAPDASKMVVCTTSGYMMIIHDLNLKTLRSDLQGFKPNNYRMMQLGKRVIPIASRYNFLFHKQRKRNRIELISDFPQKDDAQVISSLQVHPQGWCVLSRNVAINEASEWTCVHDIFDYPEDNEDVNEDGTNNDINLDTSPIDGPDDARIIVLNRESVLRRMEVDNVDADANIANNVNDEPHNNVDNAAASFGDMWHTVLTVHPARNGEHSQLMRVLRLSTSVNTTRRTQLIYQAPATQDGNRGRFRLTASSTNISQYATTYDPITSEGVENIVTISEEEVYFPSDIDTLLIIGPPRAQRSDITMDYRAALRCKTIYKNKERLTHYIEEPNAGKGFIKELCFGPDGRVVCSPYMHGIRLMAFTDDCEAFMQTTPRKPPEVLREIRARTEHKDIVLCCKFSPIHCLVVSGCHSGEIIWNQPNF